MKIVKRSEFLALPTGTVFSKYKHCLFEDLMIKGDTSPVAVECGDFWYQSIADAIECSGSEERFNKLFSAAETGNSLVMDFHCEGRDGLYEPMDSMYAIWERADVESLISRLQETLG